MRNLKRVLALAMALVMTLSLMVIGVSAASYPDADQIDADYTEAITVLTNLGVFRGQGSDNGTAAFAPKAILTRAEASALIYRLMSGDVEDKNLDLYDYSTFGDVAEGEWYTGYVTYAATKRAVVGYGDGNFHPEDEVTGVQVLKIMLCAIGYGQNGEYEGAGWKDNVLTTATDLGLLDGIAVGTNDLDKGASRELVAQLLFNSVTIPYMVQWSTAFGYQPVKLSASVGEGANPILFITLGNKQFGLVNTADEITAVGRKAGTTTLGSTTVINTNTPWTDIGYAASVWTVPTPGAKTLTAVSDVTIVGKSLKVTTDGTTVAKSKVIVEDSARVYFNGEYVGKYSETYTTDDGVIDTAKEALSRAGTVGVKVDYIDNDNGGRAEVVVVTEYSVASVTGITSTTNAGSNAIVEGSTYLIEHGADTAAREAARVADSNLIADQALAVGDLVTYVEYPYSFKGENDNAKVSGDYYVTVADVTTGKYTQINYKSTTRDHDSYVIGDVDYVVSEVNATCNADALAYLQARSNNAYVNVGNTVDVYTDPYGNILHVNTTAVAKDYLYVIRNDHSSSVLGTTYATVAYADGTIENVYLSQADQNILNEIPSHIYSYTAKGSALEIKTAGCLDTTNAPVELKATTQLANGLYMNNSTIVVDLRGNKVGDTQAAGVYTGWANMPHVLNAKLHYIASNGVIKLAFLVDGEDYVAATDFIVYTTGYHTYTVNADRTRTYNLPVIQDGEPAIIALNEAQYAFVCELGVGIYNFSNQLNTYKFTAFTEPEVKSYITWSNGLLLETVNGATAGLSYDENTKLYTLDITNGKYYQYTMTAGMDAAAYNLQHVIGTGSTKMAYVVTNNKGVATEIYVVDGSIAAQTSANAVDPDIYTKVVPQADGALEYRVYFQKNGEITTYGVQKITYKVEVIDATEDDNVTVTPVGINEVIKDSSLTITVKYAAGYHVDHAPRITVKTADTETIYDMTLKSGTVKTGLEYTYTFEVIQENLTATVSGDGDTEQFILAFQEDISENETKVFYFNYYTVDENVVTADKYLAAVPTKTGYTFKEWNPTGWSAGEKVGTQVANPVYTENSYNLTVRYVSVTDDGEEIAEIFSRTEAGTLTYSAVLAYLAALPNPEIEGYVAGERIIPDFGKDGTDVVVTVPYTAVVPENTPCGKQGCDCTDCNCGAEGCDCKCCEEEDIEEEIQEALDKVTIAADVYDGKNKVQYSDAEVKVKAEVEKEIQKLDAYKDASVKSLVFVTQNIKWDDDVTDNVEVKVVLNLDGKDIELSLTLKVVDTTSGGGGGH